MNARDLAFGVGSAVAIVGLLAVFTPAIDPAALAGARLRPLVGVGGVAFGSVLLVRWFRSDPYAHEPPERERLAPLPAPGDDLDEVLALAGSGDEETARFYRSQARDSLALVAVAVLSTHRDLTAEEAREQLATGSWTDDTVAARFFVAGADFSDGVRGSIATATGGEHPTLQRARRAVGELRRIAAAEGER